MSLANQILDSRKTRDANQSDACNVEISGIGLIFKTKKFSSDIRDP